MAIFSILKNAAQKDIFHFYVLDNKISEKNKQKLNSLQQTYTFELTYLPLDEKLKVILKHAKLHIDSEGGLVHLRHAIKGGPSVVLFGPTSPLSANTPSGLETTRQIIGFVRP